MSQWFGVFQKFGKALMVPVALLPAAGILLGLGAALTGPLAESWTFLQNGTVEAISAGMLQIGLSIFANFFQRVGAVIMGRKTYEEVLVLEPDGYPYDKIPNYILTRSPDREAEHVTFTDEPIEQLVERLKQDVDGDIWLVGGRRGHQSRDGA